MQARRRGGEPKPGETLLASALSLQGGSRAAEHQTPRTAGGSGLSEPARAELCPADPRAHDRETAGGWAGGGSGSAGPTKSVSEILGVAGQAAESFGNSGVPEAGTAEPIRIAGRLRRAPDGIMGDRRETASLGIWDGAGGCRSRYPSWLASGKGRAGCESGPWKPCRRVLFIIVRGGGEGGHCGPREQRLQVGPERTLGGEAEEGRGPKHPAASGGEGGAKVFAA